VSAIRTARAWRFAIPTIIVTSACVGHQVPLAPSAVILPDAVTVNVGERQTFTVQYATVRGFTISADRGNWTDCVQIDADYQVANAIRVIAQRACEGYVYIDADLGAGRSPLLAVMSIR
jgi:hypothetical protein